MEKPLVSVCCLTFNHAPYIRDCLNGFINQKVDFDIEILIHDDASTDGTTEIIEEFQDRYPDMIKPIFQRENQFSKGVRGISFRYNFPRAKGKYIALCEGDDFWTDHCKLKKQVDFLEKNTNFSISCGGYRKIDIYSGVDEMVIQKKIGSSRNKKTYDNGFEFSLIDLSTSWLTKTLTVLFRKENLDLHILQSYKYSRDVHLYHQLLTKGKGFYFTEVFGAYRVHPGGIHSLKSKEIKAENAYLVFEELYRAQKDVYTRSQYYNASLSKLKIETKRALCKRAFSNQMYFTLKCLQSASSIKDILRVLIVLFRLTRN